VRGDSLMTRDHGDEVGIVKDLNDLKRCAGFRSTDHGKPLGEWEKNRLPCRASW